VLTLVLGFRSQVGAFLERVTRAKGPGFELEAQLAAIEISAATLAEAAPATGTPAAAAEEEVAAPIPATARTDPTESPKARLARITKRIDDTAREILASSREPDTWEGRSMWEKVRALDADPYVRASTLQFQSVAERILNDPAASDDDARRAVLAGQDLLNALNRIPHERHYVFQPTVELFADEAGERPITDYRAVMLQSRLTDGSHMDRVFPTSRDYEAGQQVSWEWGTTPHGRTFYREPTTGELRLAWDSALDFKGRPLDELA
jgi:hypothetical protein